MQQVLGFSPIETGLAFLPISVLAFAGAGTASQLALRAGPGPVMSGGLALVAAGCAWLTGISADGTYASELLPGFVLFGIGLGLGSVSATIAATAGVDAAQRRPEHLKLAGTAMRRSRHARDGVTARRGRRRKRLKWLSPAGVARARRCSVANCSRSMRCADSMRECVSQSPPARRPRDARNGSHHRASFQTSG
jgi:hypothetical protein